MADESNRDSSNVRRLALLAGYGALLLAWHDNLPHVFRIENRPLVGSLIPGIVFFVGVCVSYLSLLLSKRPLSSALAEGVGVVLFFMWFASYLFNWVSYASG
jgi:hypothetical protein